MNLSAPFIKRPVMTTVLMMTLLLLGFFSFRTLPVCDLPNVNYSMININAAYSGASPEVMAQTVTVPLEKELATITGLKQIISETSHGFTYLNLIFELNVSSDAIEKEVQSALEKAESFLPANLEQKPTYQKVNPNQDAIIYLILTSPSSPLAELYDYAYSHVEQRLARIEGVGKVKVHGSPYAVRIYLNPELMAARGVTFDEVQNKVTGATKTLPLGDLDTPGRRFALQVPSHLQQAKDFESLALTPQVHLKDVASIKDDLESDEIFHFITKQENNFAVILGVQKQDGANAVKISEELKKILPAIRNELPASMHLELWFDKATWIKEAIEDVEWSLVIAFALVIGVIFLSLGHLRETLIAATALPLSIIGTFIVMQLLNFNLDLLSLLALTLSMGFVIDDAIVVLENIVRHREEGLLPLEAAIKGSKEISFTILSMTLSLVAVFIPLLFMQDITGRLFREFSITLAVSILVSGFVSLTLTPMLSSRFLSGKKKEPSKLHLSLLTFYRHTLKWCFSHKKSTLGVAVATIVLSVFLFPLLRIDLFPEEDRGFVWTFLQLPGGLSKRDNELYQEKINQIVQKHPAVDNFATLNFKDFQIYLIRLVSSNRLPQAKVIEELKEELTALPDTQPFMRGIQLISNNMGSYATNNYQYVIRGQNYEEVRRSAEALKQTLLSNPLFINPELNLQADAPTLEIAVFEQQAERLGLTRQTIQSLLQNAYAGGSIGKIEKNSEQYKVFLELDSEFQKNTASLAKLYLKTPSGVSVPLKAVASWKEKVGLQSITHIDLLSSLTLSFDLSKDKPVKQSLALLKKIAKETLPPSVSGKLEGIAEMTDKTSSNTLSLLFFAFVAMYVVLSILYESFVHPFTILSALPFACLGGILTLLIFKESLSLYSMVGFLLLIGIVKKNGIMMVDYALEMQRKEKKSPLEAIEKACLIRLRPIMMTTVAAVMGAIPIAIGIGAGSETRRGLGLVIAGGLLFSQFLTLYVTPILYLYLEKLRLLRRKKATTMV